MSKISGPKRFDSLSQEVFLNLWRAYDRLKLLEDETFGAFGITAQQYNAMRLLERGGVNGIATLELSKRLVSKAPDITRLLDRLVERGLVVRNRRSGNRRVVDLSLSEDGQQLLQKLFPLVQDCQSKQLGHLSDKEKKALIGLLERVREPHEGQDSPWRVRTDSA